MEILRSAETAAFVSQNLNDLLLPIQISKFLRLFLEEQKYPGRYFSSTAVSPTF
jgi:hypothetical protein